MAMEIHDETFGVLRPDVWAPGPETVIDSYYSETGKFNGERIAVSLSEESGNLSRVMDRNHQLFSLLERHEQEVRRSVAGEHLQNVNDNWNDGDPLSTEEFMRMMILKSISISSDGEIGLSYASEELLGDHAINVRLNEQMQVIDSSFDG